VSRRARLALLGAYAVCTFGAFPHPVAGRVVDLGVVLAWASPALLVLLVRGLSPRRALRWGFLAGLVAHTAILHWIWVVTVVYGQAPALAGVLGPLGLGAYIAAFTGLFGWGHAALGRHGLASPLAAAVLWTALDHLRSFALTGFPWATLGYAQHENPALCGLLPYTGVYGLSFATALGGAALADLARPGEPRARRTGAWAALAVVVALHGAGAASWAWREGPKGPSLRVAVLQGNIDQGVKWSREWRERTLGIYEELSRRAARQGARLVVWPETAVPGALDADAGLRQRVADLARETGAAYVVGGVGLTLSPDGARRFYDSAFVVTPEGAFADRYDKAHLVPFGEYVPLRALWGTFLSAVASGIASGDVSPGERPRAVPLDLPDRERVRAGIPICYELLFPDLVRRFTASGAQILLAITNDAWYGRTGAPYQFLAMTEMRAAESGLWAARAANTGVSAFIDPRGRVRARTPIFERELLVADVPLRDPGAPATPYVRYGDVFAYAQWLGVAGLAVAAARRRRRKGPS